MKTFYFNFYIGGKFKFARTYAAENISEAWRMAHDEADAYPTKRFIEISNI